MGAERGGIELGGGCPFAIGTGERIAHSWPSIDSILMCSDSMPLDI
jgi:hypothetical protein